MNQSPAARKKAPKTGPEHWEHIVPKAGFILKSAADTLLFGHFSPATSLSPIDLRLRTK
jgi:hypothetical protein